LANADLTSHGATDGAIFCWSGSPQVHLNSKFGASAIGVPSGDATQSATVRLKAPVSASPTQFLRLKLIQ